jgi:hypothetical protein
MRFFVIIVLLAVTALFESHCNNPASAAVMAWGRSLLKEKGKFCQVHFSLFQFCFPFKDFRRSARDVGKGIFYRGKS